MNTTLHPIFEQIIKEWTLSFEAERVAADIAANADKADWHRRNDAAALLMQIGIDDKHDRQWSNER